MPMFAAVKADGRRYSPFLIPLRWTATSAVGSSMWGASAATLEPPYHCHSAAHSLARGDEHFDLRRHYEVCARAELYQTEALAEFEAVAGLLPADDPSREHARDLLADDGHAVALYGQSVLLVDEAGRVARGGLEAALRVGHVEDRAADGRAVDVNVEWREEYAYDCGRVGVFGRELADERHATVG